MKTWALPYRPIRMETAGVGLPAQYFEPEPETTSVLSMIRCPFHLALVLLFFFPMARRGVVEYSLRLQAQHSTRLCRC